MKLWKYTIIEYEVKKMTNDSIEYARRLHKTNNKLLYYLIIICFKLSNIKYKVIIRD